MRVLPKMALVTLLAGCTHELSSEERLDRETASDPMKEAVSGEQLEKVNCSDTKIDLGKARDEQRPETDRVQSYIDLYEALRKKSQMFDDAMTRNPDLAYTEGSAKLV